MIHFRSFRNTDPPALCEIWRSQPPRRGLVSSLSPMLLDRYVLSKPYFDREGLIVAEDDDRPIGFAHAGFGPEIEGGKRSERGVLSMVMTLPTTDSNSLASDLVDRAEQYLRERGVRECTALGVGELCPYYLGLNGGSSVSGVLNSDGALGKLFTSCGYERRREWTVWQRQMASFRPPVDRKLMQVRREFHVEAQIDPPLKGWWQACMYVAHDLTRFDIRQRSKDKSLGRVLFWEMEPIASSWGLHANGIINIEIHPDFRRRGLATFLLGESLRQLQAQGVTVVEVHSDAEDPIAAELLKKLGFQSVDMGNEMVKSLLST
ncbi:MAG: GNAT family N-acetyltransferase [Pirellulaceae bacterium]|nr:GNAT family N-acetyltransferase [Planctomycetaceae bacterium]